jgi:hypothetical protein
MISLNEIYKMIFKGKEQHDQDVAIVLSKPFNKITVKELSNASADEYANKHFWVIVNNNLVEVHSAMYTGLVLPDGNAQWAIFNHVGGYPCHMGYVFDFDDVYITSPDYKPIKGAWALYQEISS